MKLRGLNVSRRRDPEGNYVVVMDLETYEKLKEAITRLGLNPEPMGSTVIVRDRAWNRIKRLTNIARELGISVFED